MDISLLAPNILPEGLTAPNMTSAMANPTEDKDLVNNEIPSQKILHRRVHRDRTVE